MKGRFSLKFIGAMICIVILTTTLPTTLPVVTQHTRTVFAKESKSGGVKKGLELYKKGDYSAARKQFKKYKETASEASIKKMSDKMKKAYLIKVTSYKTFSEVMNTEGGEYIWGYFLTDIDKDGSAELLIQHGASEADCMVTIYKYSKGKVVKVKDISGSHSVLYAYGDGNGFLKLSGQMGYETISLITFNKNKATEKEIGSRDIGKDEYMYLPYKLENHISADGLGIDYSDLE